MFYWIAINNLSNLLLINRTKGGFASREDERTEPRRSAPTRAGGKRLHYRTINQLIRLISSNSNRARYTRSAHRPPSPVLHIRPADVFIAPALRLVSIIVQCNQVLTRTKLKTERSLWRCIQLRPLILW